MTAVGQYVTREDGTRWKVAEIRPTLRRHWLGNTVSPVATTTYRLVRGGQSAQVEVWGRGAASEIGHAPAEVLTPAPVAVRLGGAA